MLAWLTRTPRDVNWRIALVGAGDDEALAGIHGKSFAMPWSAEDFARFAGDSLVEIYAAFKGRKLAGFIVLRCAADEAEILTLAVAPDWRRRGAGRRLVEKALAAAAARGAHALYLEVAEKNRAAMELYERLGFACVGRRERYYQSVNFPGGDAGTALILKCDLDNH
jgi:[ribosomal protein S18]-alanine N-acetyltransferase